MTALIAILTSTAGKWIGMALAVIVPLFVAWRAALKSGAASERAKQSARETEAVKTAKQVQDDVSAMTADQRRKELIKWSKR